MAFAAFGSQGPAVEQAPRKRSWIAWVLLAPGLAYLALFFLTPFISLILTSLQAPVDFGDVGQYQAAFKIENYAMVVSQYWPHFLRAFHARVRSRNEMKNGAITSVSMSACTSGQRRAFTPMK